MKRVIFSFVLFLCVISSFAHIVVKDGIYYDLNNTTMEAEVVGVIGAYTCTSENEDGSKYDDGSVGYIDLGLIYDVLSDNISIPKTIVDKGEIYRIYRIGEKAFSMLPFKSITIPNSVTSIGDEAFSYCSELTSITIPNSVTSIGDGAFRSCSELTSITIPNSVTSIGDFAFSDCSLTSITIPNSVTSIGEYAFNYCSGLTSITIPNSVRSIGDYAFSECSGLTSITIPNSVRSIGDYAFYECSGLTSITIPNSVRSIGDFAFYCSGLTSITIPNSVKSIGHEAFAGLQKLKVVKCYAEEMPICEDDNWGAGVICIETDDEPTVIFDCSEATLYVPKESLDAYRSTEPWSSFGAIKPIPQNRSDD